MWSCHAALYTEWQQAKHNYPGAAAVSDKQEPWGTSCQVGTANPVSTQAVETAPHLDSVTMLLAVLCRRSEVDVAGYVGRRDQGQLDNSTTSMQGPSTA